MFGYTSDRHIAVVYHIVTSVLLENSLLVKFIRIYIRDPSGVFSVTSASDNIDDVISRHRIARLPNFAKRRLKDGERSGSLKNSLKPT